MRILFLHGSAVIKRFGVEPEVAAGGGLIGLWHGAPAAGGIYFI